MAVPVDNLTALARTLSIVRQGPAEVQPGQPVAASLTPSPSALKATDLVSSPLNITWLVKGVQFASQLLEDPNLDKLTRANVIGGMPISQLVGTLTGTLGGTLSGTLGGTVTGTLGGGLKDEQKTLLDKDAKGPGVPGMLGQIVTSLPVPVEVPVSLRVEWSVRDNSDPDAGRALEVDKDFLAPGGLAAPDASFVFPPAPVELTSTPSLDPTTFYLHARVKLAVGKVETDWVKLPGVPVIVPPLPIPTVLALFVHSNFAARSHSAGTGAVLCVVPADSPLRSFEELSTRLREVLGVITPFSKFARFASFFLPLQTLTDALLDHVALAEPNRVQFRSAVGNQIRDLHDIRFDTFLTAEDSLSSLILIGQPGRHVEFFVKRDLDPADGHFSVKVGRRVNDEQEESFGLEMHTIVRNLHSAAPESEPTKQEVVVHVAPNGWRPDPPHDIEIFGDELSSLKFN